MNQLVYLVAFGSECLEQFKLLYKGLRLCDVDVCLITDQNYLEEKVNVIRIDTVKDARNQYIFRIGFQDYINIEDYDRVWYMDCDMLIFGDIFKVESDAIIVSREQFQMNHDCFASALTHEERVKYFNLPAINGGFYSVPKHYFDFFDDYKAQVERFIKDRPEVNIPEQQVLNAMYARGKYDFELMEVGFPEKGVRGDEMIYHFACYQFKDKLKLMQNVNR
jgi:hypothetical protein